MCLRLGLAESASSHRRGIDDIGQNRAVDRQRVLEAPLLLERGHLAQRQIEIAQLERARWPGRRRRPRAANRRAARRGHNEIEIKNLAPGAFSLPPFFMLDYADIAFQSS